MVAKFFQEAFLGASIAYTPTYLTRKLYDSTIFAGRRNATHAPPWNGRDRRISR